MAGALEQPSIDALQPGLERLIDWHLVQSTGRTQATRYFVDPGLLRSLNFTGETILKRNEPHRLAAWVLEDLQRHFQSARVSVARFTQSKSNACWKSLSGLVLCASKATTAGDGTGQ